MEAIRTRIGGAREAHRVESPEAYAARAKRVLRQKGLAPVLVEGKRLEAYVSGGWWVVMCETRPDGRRCMNAPAAEPEWGIAVCFECGQVHEAVFPPLRQLGEAVLVQRPNPRDRSWFPSGGHAWRKRAHGGKPERVTDLGRENRKNLGAVRGS